MARRTLIVVQARTGSSRLPGKVLLPVAGAPMLVRMLERLRAVKAPVELVVATTQDGADDAVCALAADAGVPSFRGHATDLLDRHVKAAQAFGADVVVKIPSDCPLIDPAVVDRVLAAFDESAHDYVGNLHPATYPDGNDVEIMPRAALELAWREASKPHEREHTTSFLWDQPGRFRIGSVRWETGLDYSMSHRFTVDYPEDYAFVKAVYEELGPSGALFSLADILALLEARPDIFQLNAKYAGVNWYRHALSELRTVRSDETRAAPRT